MKSDIGYPSPAIGVVDATRRCVVVVQESGSAEVSTRSFSAPGEALGFVRTGSSDGGWGCAWVDLQGCTEEENRGVLQALFPGMQPSQMEVVLAPDACDVVWLGSTRAQCATGCIECFRGCGRAQPLATAREEEEEAVLCTFACSEWLLLTVHAAPFAGFAELLRHVGGGRAGGGPSRVGRGLLQGAARDAMTSAGVLCTLVCFACEAFLPDPTALLSEVGNIDEMVLLIAPGQQDQSDLLRRVALLRRRISNFRTGLYGKEKLLQEFVAPAMRLSFVASEPDTVRAYKEVLEKVVRVSGRLEDTRDMLNQANLNFLTGVSMRMSQGSAGIDFRLTLLNQVAAICLPINLVITIFGMNCRVPYMTDVHETLVPFWCICGALATWAILCMTPLLHEAIRGPKSSAIAQCN